MNIGRVPPHNNEAEQALLGTALLVPKLVPTILSKINREDLYRDQHKLIFDAINELNNHNEEANLVTVMGYLQAKGEIEAMGGPTYLATLTSILPSTSGVSSYIRMVKETALRRRLIIAGVGLAESGYEGGDADDLINQISSEIIDITADTASGDAVSTLAELMPEVMDNIEQACATDDISGVPSGLKELDEITWGWQKTDLIILAGRPGMGKTTMALNFTTNAAKARKNVAFFSLEMSKQQLALKMLSEVSGVASRSMQRGNLNDNSWPKITRAMGHIQRMGRNIMIDETPALTVPHLRNKLKLLMMRRRVDLVIVDYLQLMQGKGENRNQEITSITGALKGLAKETGLPVIALSQLSRKCEDRTDKRPLQADLRDSGAIEQDADVILMIYRDDFYNRDSPIAGITELNAVKHRNGDTGFVQLGFDGRTSSFHDLSYQQETNGGHR